MNRKINYTRKNIKKALAGSFLASVGFILSPLTWWNDLFVNLPLAFAFAYIIGLLISNVISVTLPLFIGLMVVGYFLTNVLGFLLMQKGAVHITSTKEKQKVKFCWKKNLIYSLLACILVGLSIHFGLLDLGETDKLSASILQVEYLVQ